MKNPDLDHRKLRFRELPIKMKIKGENMIQLVRSNNVAIYKNENAKSSVGFAVGKIEIFLDTHPSLKYVDASEEFKSRNSRDDKIGWIKEDYDSAFDIFKKLVKETDFK